MTIGHFYQSRSETHVIERRPVPGMRKVKVAKVVRRWHQDQKERNFSADNRFAHRQCPTLSPSINSRYNVLLLRENSLDKGVTLDTHLGMEMSDSKEKVKASLTLFVHSDPSVNAQRRNSSLETCL